MNAKNEKADLLPSRRQIFSALFLPLLAVLVALYSPVLFGHRCFFYTDTTFFLEPHAKFLANTLRAGQFPLWNPFEYCGMPQIAITFPSLFYLPDLLLIVLPFDTGLAVSMIFHIIMAALFTYLLARSFSYSTLEAFSAALIFATSGYMLGLSSNHSLVAGLSWLPATLWSLRSIDINHKIPKFWQMLCGTALLSLFILSGRPEIVGPGSLVFLFFIFWSAFERWRKHKILIDGVLAWQLRALFLAAVFTLPATLPVGEWLSLSKRATGLAPEEIFLYSAHWYDIVSMFFGPSLGDLRLHAAALRPLVSFANLPPYVACAYVGPIALTLAFWGAQDKTWKYKNMCVILFVATIFFSLGSYTSLIPAMVRFIPALGFVRFPIKLLGYAIFVMAFMAARGLSCLRSGNLTLRNSAFTWLFLALTGAAVAACSHSGHLLLPFAGTNQPMALQLHAQFLIATSAIYAAFLGIGTCAIAMGVKASKLSTRHGTGALLFAVACTLAWNAFTLESKTASPSFWSTPSFAADALAKLRAEQHLGNDVRILNLCLERLTVPPSLNSANPGELTANDYQYDRQVLKANCNMDFQIPDSLGFEGTSRGDYTQVGLHSYLESSQTSQLTEKDAVDLPLARFCAITATRFVITQKYRTIGKKVINQLLDTRLFHLALEDEPNNIRIYTVISSLPNFYVTHNWKWISSHNAILDAIVTTGVSTFDPLTCTSLETVDGAALIPCMKQNINSTWQDRIHFDQNAFDNSKFKVVCEQPGFLILSDQFYPGWHAKLDGKSTTIYQANGFTRAVFVPTGEHVIEFQYLPDSLLLGLGLAGLGLILCLYLYVKERSKSGLSDASTSSNTPDLPQHSQA